MNISKHLPTKIFLIVFLFLLFIPLYWMFIGSLQDIHGVMKMPPNLFPHNLNFKNYQYLLAENVLIWLKNTIIVVMGTVIISVLLSVTAGYTFSVYTFKYKKIIWTAYLAQMMIPRISLLIPLYVIMKHMKLSGTHLAVIFPVVFTPLGVYLAKNYFDSIPKSIIESARIDGANEIQIISKIVAPISKPIVAALSLFAGIGALQDYLWQMLVLQKVERQTLLVGLMRKAAERGGLGEMGVNPIGRSFAVGILLFLPLLLIFLFANKYFVEGISGAIKE